METGGGNVGGRGAGECFQGSGTVISEPYRE
jgi:hypothetical protein